MLLLPYKDSKILPVSASKKSQKITLFLHKNIVDKLSFFSIIFDNKRIINVFGNLEFIGRCICLFFDIRRLEDAWYSKS